MFFQPVAALLNEGMEGQSAHVAKRKASVSISECILSICLHLNFLQPSFFCLLFFLHFIFIYIQESIFSRLFILKKLLNFFHDDRTLEVVIDKYVQYIRASKK